MGAEDLYREVILDHYKNPRGHGVIEDNLLIELAQLVHQPKISRTLPSASTSASTSSVVL